MSDIDFATPNDREWLIQIADALDAAERIHPNIIQMSDELARQLAAGLRRISEGRSESPWAAAIVQLEKVWRRFILGERSCYIRRT